MDRNFLCGINHKINAHFFIPPLKYSDIDRSLSARKYLVIRTNLIWCKSIFTSFVWLNYWLFFSYMKLYTRTTTLMRLFYRDSEFGYLFTSNIGLRVLRIFLPTFYYPIFWRVLIPRKLYLKFKYSHNFLRQFSKLFEKKKGTINRKKNFWFYARTIS